MGRVRLSPYLSPYLTLDPDVAKLIEREQKMTNLPLKAIVNEKLRLGFAAKDNPVAAAVVSLPAPLDLGRARFPNFDDITSILEWAEDHPH